MNTPENTETTTAAETAAKPEPKAKPKKEPEAKVETKADAKPAKVRRYKIGNETFIELWPEMLTVVTDRKHILFEERAVMPLKEDMVISVLENGIKKPPLVRQVDDNVDGEEVFEVVDGRQRVRAAVAANQRLEARKAAPRRIVCKLELASVDSNAVRIKNLTNIHVIPVDPMTKAESMAQAISTGESKQNVAQEFWTSEKTVDRHLALLRLCKELKEAVRYEKVGLVDALELGKVSHKEQRAAVERLEKGEPLFVEAAEGSEEEGEGEKGAGETKPVKKKLPKAPAWKKMQVTLKKLKAYQAPSAARQEKVDLVALVIEGIYGSTKKAAREFDELLEDLGLTEDEGGDEDEEAKPKVKKKGLGT